MARSQLNSSQLALEHPARLEAQDPQPATLRMAQPSTLRHQSTTNMLGGLLSQGIKFAVVIYIARVFPPAQFGWLSFGIAVNAFLFIVGHFGLPVFGARSVAGTGVVCGDLLLSIFVSRMLLALTATALALGILWTIPNVGRQELLLVALFGLSNVPVAAMVDWVFQGLYRQEISAAINILWQLCWLGLVVAGIRMGAGVAVVPAALIVAAMIAAAVGFAWLSKRYIIAPISRSGRSLFQQTRQILAEGSALGSGTLLITVLVWIDLILIRLLRGDEAAGLYAAGNRAALAMAMLASFFVQGAFPLLSSSTGDVVRFSQCFQQCYDDLALAFVPASLWAIFYAKQILWVMFRRPEYLAAERVFQIFQVVFLATIFENLYGMGAVAANHHDADYRRTLMISTTIFVPLCVGLLLGAGIAGAAVAALIAQLICGFLFVRQSRAMVRASHLQALGFPLLAGALVVALGSLFHLTLVWGSALLLLAYGALLTNRFQPLALQKGWH